MRNILLLFIALFGFGYAQAQDCTGADHTVLAGNYYYSPSTLTVTAGETIAFLNEGGFHNVNGVSSTLGATWGNPETFSLGSNSGSAEGVCMGTVTLNTPGTYQYDCSIGSHAANGMVGTIVVEAAGSATPTDNAADPTLDAGDVVSIYGGSYDNIANNYNPFWAQSGTVDEAYDPGTGNTVLQYANFNYQGTEVSLSDLSGMTHLHVDVWVAAGNDRMLKVTPVNSGTGAGEFLVEVPLTPGAWNSVDLTKAAFEGMTWDGVFQMKFDGQFNADGSANGAGWDVYLDNIYFWNDGTGSGPPSGETVDVTFTVNMENETVSSDGVSLAGGAYFGFPGDNPMSDNGDGTWSTTIAVPVGFTGNYTFTNGGAACGWNCKENIAGQDCADGPYADRLLSNITEDTTINTCFGECTTDGSCSAPSTQYNVTFQVDMSNSDLDGTETIYVTGSFEGWCGPCDNVMTDSGNGLYTHTVSLDPGSYEHKFMINAWGGDEQAILGTACDFVPGDGFGNRGFELVDADIVLPVQCFDFCGTCEEQNTQGTVDITWNVNMSNEDVSPDGVHLAGGGTFGNPGDNPLTDNGDGTWSITMTLPEGVSSYYIFTNGGAACSWGCKEDLAGLPCGDPGNFNDRYLDNITQDTTFNFCFGECGTDGVCVGDDGGGGTDPTGPTDNAADPTLDAGDVVSIYGGTYDNIATNYNPFWAQSGTVDDAYDPGTGNTVLQYANFNYQGTEVTVSDLSGMTHLHVDVWVAADNDRMLKVTPVNGGTGAGEFLVEVPLTPGAWNSVDLTKAAFEGMTWDGVFQMKFDGQFNADGSGNGAGWDVYLDNIYFWNDGTGSGPPSNDTYDVTFNVNTANIDVGPNGMYLGGGNYFGDAQGNAMSDDDEDGVYTVTVAVPAGYSGNYVFLNSPNDGGDWGAKENLIGLPCADGPYNDRLLPAINADTTISTCFEQCSTDGLCSTPPATYAVTFQVDMSDAGLVGGEVIYVTGSFDGWCGPCDNVLTDDDNDNVYTGVVNLIPGDYEFKYMINAWGGDEQNIGGTACDFVPGDDFGNRGFTLGEADLVLDVNCFDTCGPCENGGGGPTDPADSLAVTFNVDMNNYGGTFGFVNVAGSWNGFCADCNQMTDDDMDGIWTATISLPPGENYRYKYQVDSWADQEDLAPGDNPVGPCVVKEGGFTNRDLDVAGTEAIDLGVVCWGSCWACIGQDDVPGCNDSAAANYDEAATANDGTCIYDVTFSVNMNEYPLNELDSVYVNGEFNGWCGACNAMLDEDGNGIYETTIPLTSDYYEYKFTVNAWSAEENLAGAGGCVTENFGFTNRVLQLATNQSQPVVCWNSCSDCEGGGEVFGCTDQAATNYSDLATDDDGSCTYMVTFQVDMNEYAGSFSAVNLNGTFTGWCGACVPMTDDDVDGVYQATVELTLGTVEYKFTVDGWADQEYFSEGAVCTSTIDGYTNRSIDVTGAATLDVVCWASCYACDVATGCTDSDAQNYDADAVADDGSCSYIVTIRLDMTTSTLGAGGVHIAGSFQGWDPGATAMTSPGLNLYEYTLQLSNGAYQYIFINGNTWDGQETVPADCGADNGLGGYNREVVVAGSDMTLDVVCFNSCEACAGCTDPLSAEFSPWAGADDGSCATPLVFGCTYPDADNYNAAATSEDGTCVFSGASDCPTDIDGDGSTAVGDLLVILGAFGQACE